MPTQPHSPTPAPQRPHTNSGTNTTWLGPLFCLLFAAAALSTILLISPVAREIAANTSITLFTIFSTPFILEATTLALSILALFAYNQWRRQKDGSDWVYLVTQEPDEHDPKPSACETQRLQSTILNEKPQPTDEIETAADVLEGYLELGMPSQALAELPKLEAASKHPHPRLTPLRIRILSANLNTEQALQLLHQTLQTTPPPNNLPTLLQTCLDNARWLLQHLQRRDLATLWLNEAQNVHPFILSDNDPLHQLSQSA